MNKLLKGYKTFLCILALISVLLSMSVLAVNTKGCINAVFDTGTTLVSGAKIELYQVFNIDSKTSALSWTDTFEDYQLEIDIKTESDAARMAGVLESYILRDSIPSIKSATTDDKGMVSFDDLSYGVYLLRGDAVRIENKNYTPVPFFVTISDSESSNVRVFIKHEVFSDETVNMKALKVWRNDTENNRPASITVQLLRDGEVYDEQILNARNDWRYLWRNLEAGKNWSIVEKSVPSKYSLKVTYDGITTVLTNTRQSGGGGSSIVKPTPSPTPTPTQTPSPTPSATPVPSQTPEPTVTPSPDPTPTPEVTPTPSPSPSSTPTPSPTPTVTPSPSSTPTPTPGSNGDKLPQTGPLYAVVMAVGAIGVICMVAALCFKRDKTRGIYYMLIGFGLACVLFVVFMVIHESGASTNAGEVSEITVSKIEEYYEETIEEIEGEDHKDYEIDPYRLMPVREFNGIWCVGRIEIPSIGIDLPVGGDASKETLASAPGLWEGTAYQGNMIICGHNYQTHFGRLSQLQEGDRLTFTDMDGNQFEYEVISQETIGGYDIDAMRSGEWDMTLFSCTLGGLNRVTIRCKLLTNSLTKNL